MVLVRVAGWQVSRAGERACSRHKLWYTQCGVGDGAGRHNGGCLRVKDGDGQWRIESGLALK
jgi:hypothetical protein